MMHSVGMIREQIAERVSAALAALGLPVAGVIVEYIEDAAHGDITTNAAMVVAKAGGKAPRALAEDLLAALGEIEGVEKAEIAGPGFINFTFTSTTLAAAVSAALDEGGKWGKSATREGEVVMVEYTQPNPFKEFHVGHLMGNVIGESLARLIESAGAKVIRANYQGDVGVHVACAIWGIKKLGIDPSTADEFGTAYVAGAAAYKDDPIAKSEIDAINTKLYERSDPELNALYDSGREKSLAAFERIYAILGTKFDHYFFESETGPIGKEIVLAHPELFPESDGARIFKGEEYGLHTRVFINAKGLPTYEAKELGLEKLKKDLYPETTLLVIETANEINEYFKVIAKALELIYPAIAAQLKHVSHGLMKLPTGKMSSRTGSIITGESLLNDLRDAAKERASESRADDHEQLAEAIAVAAIKYQILRQASGKDIIFDRERALSLEGDSGPYIQYAYARASSVIAAAAEAGVKAVVEAPQTSDERAVARLLMQFPFVVNRAQESYEPHHVATYAAQLAGLYNGWYAREHVIGTDAAPRRTAITHAVAITLRNALYLLGIEAPMRM